MSPDEKFEEKRYEEEEEKLNSLVNKLSEDDRERIYTEGMVELWLNCRQFNWWIWKLSIYIFIL